MAGVDAGSGDKSGGRRSGNFEINMIPMIDLLMVTISFLLITAEWMHMTRIEADAMVPGPAQPCDDNGCPKEKKLHVTTVDGQKFVLTWKDGSTVVSTTEIESKGVFSAKDNNVHYPDLAESIVKEWKSGGVHHSRDDAAFDRAVIHASNDLPYGTLVGVMDAVSAPRRPAGKNLSASSFAVSFAVD
jgi:biopolymer transport protein ExbD